MVSDYPGDEDWFVMRGVAGRSYVLQPRRFAQLSVYDQGGDRLLASTSEATSQLIFDAEVDGDLYISVTALRRDDYVLTVEGFTDDHGSTLNKATPIDVGATIQGEFEVSFETDYFSFQAEAGMQYYVELDHLWSLRALDAAGNELAGRDSFYLTVAVEEPQTVFIEAVGSRDYQLRLLTVGLDDHGNDAESATPIELGRWATGVNEFPFDVDTFSLMAEPGQNYQINIFGSSRSESEGGKW